MFRAIVFAMALTLPVLQPALAADGTYTGKGVYESGNPNTCRGVNWKLEVTGTNVAASVFRDTGSVANSVSRTSGIIQPDGTLRMTYSAFGGSSSGQVNIELKLEGDRFVGYSQSQTCRYNITATR